MACVSTNLTPQYGTGKNGSPFVSADSIAAIFHIYLCLQFGRSFNTKALIMDYRNLIPFHGWYPFYVASDKIWRCQKPGLADTAEASS